MPYISVHTNLIPTVEVKNVIKDELGRLISIIPGKSEPVLMVEFIDNSTFYMRGSAKGSYAAVDIKCFKEAPFEANQQFTQEVFKLLERTLGIAEDHIYVTITELPTWGTRGTLK